MSPRNRLASYVLFLLGIAILTGTILYYFHIDQFQEGSLMDNIPPMLADIQLTQVITGDEAIDNIRQLHEKDFPLRDGVVAVYANRKVILWISDVGNNSAAKTLIKLMKNRISEERSPFRELGEIEQEGIAIYKLEGLGQQHYYWQSERLVLWLAADEESAESALMELITIYR